MTYQCPDCDAMLTRLAALTLELRKYLVERHKELQHGEREWERCPQEPCRRLGHALRSAGIRETPDVAILKRKIG